MKRRAQEPLLERLAPMASVPVPAIAVADHGQGNAFVVGMTPRRSVMVATTALLHPPAPRAQIRATDGPSAARGAVRAAGGDPA
jgi:hypothetical protein